MHIYIYNNGLNIWFTFNSPTERKKDAFGRLPVGGKEKIRAILYIMDRFSISQEAYHELTQQESLSFFLTVDRPLGINLFLSPAFRCH